MYLIHVYISLLKLIINSTVLDTQKFDFEHEGGRGRNDGRVATLTVAEVRRDRELAFLSDTSAEDSLIPAFDDLAYAD